MNGHVTEAIKKELYLKGFWSQYSHTKIMGHMLEVYRSDRKVLQDGDLKLIETIFSAFLVRFEMIHVDQVKVKYVLREQ